MESEEELVFQLLEEEKKTRTKRIVEEKEITTEDCLVLGVLRLNGEVAEARGEIVDVRGEVVELRKELSTVFRWLVALILGTWCTLMAALIPILQKLVGVI